MTVIVLTACPAGLRGHLTQWLLEIAAGIYVGHISARVRDRLWTRVVELAGPGRAILIYQQRGEQRLAFRVHDHQWEPVDHDGVILMRRPNDKSAPTTQLDDGWSKAAKRRRFGRRSPAPEAQAPGPAQQSE
ncbi:type I-E CRISPR-associated endoribonuclease Cas2e [Longispora sp. K20-0274]|uniref:type I-E CRISPR-associated endoribonuclease Cas2e n=1 Tax=Longispora sp. K20-0274 TaxID=3088255 RepID=UPI00399B3F40